LAHARNRCFSQVWQPNCPIIVCVLILALDTSSPAGSLAVLRDETIVGGISTNTQEAYSSRIFRHLEFLLGEVKLRVDDFDLFAVAAGPGSFTGLRVGLTAAKGWAEAYGKPIAAVSALEAIAAQSVSNSEFLVPVLDARRGEIYFGFYRRLESAAGRELALEGDECSMPPEDFLKILIDRRGANLTIVSPTPEALASVASRLETDSLRLERVSGTLAPLIGRIGFRLAKQGRVCDSLTLDANYVRRSDAEVLWKESSGS
jgi:tRNA threonylcarbamoyladenosine biosynthesis protein TsaB